MQGEAKARASARGKTMGRYDWKLRRDEMEQLRVIRDEELNLPECWFTGQEWAGTAARVYARDYRTALIEAGYERGPDRKGSDGGQ